jgi:hypothetical protein
MAKDRTPVVAFRRFPGRFTLLILVAIAWFRREATSFTGSCQDESSTPFPGFTRCGLSRTFPALSASTTFRPDP